MTRLMPRMVYVSCDDKDSAAALAAKLRTAGHVVTSIWHDETGELVDKRAGADVNLKTIAHLSNVYVQIADGKPHPGGKHVELGVALATGKSVIVFGDPENAMQFAAGIKHVLTYDELLVAIRDDEKEADDAPVE
jgi:lactam utilization protein B